MKKILIAIKNPIARFWKNHRVLSIIFAAMILYGGYMAYGKLFPGAAAETRYVLTAVQRGTVVATVAGTGQVSVLSQLDIKPQASGNVTRIAVKQGQQVNAGDLLITLDSTDAQKAVRDAKANLQSARLSLQKLQEPAASSTLTQAQNNLAQAKQSELSAKSNLVKDYDSAFNAVSAAFIDLPTMMTGLGNVLNGTTVNGNQGNAYAYTDMVRTYTSSADPFRDNALSAYQTALTAYNQNLLDYKNASRYSDQATIDALLSETYTTAKSIAEGVKDAKNFLDFVSNTLTNDANMHTLPAVLVGHENNLQSYTATANNDLNTLSSAKNSLQTDEDTIANSQLTITQNSQTLAQLQAGADPLDIQSAQLSVEQKQNALTDAEQNLSYYSIRAPFDGVVATINVSVGDPASPGSAVAVIIAPKQIANVSLNEVDVAKVKTSDKATLTFSAFPDLTMTGTVTQIDTIGTVAQGVVDYNVQLTFDTENGQIKPGMSVSANIITQADQDVLYLPSSAVKSQGTAHYVQVIAIPNTSSSVAMAKSSQGIPSAAAPTRQTVEVGIASDAAVEITSGLQEGDLVVLRTITASAATTPTAASQTTSFRIPGIGGGGLGGGR